MALTDVLLDNRRQFLRFLEQRVRDPELAADLLQASLAKSLEAGSSLESEESAVAWFYRILRNAIADHGRKKSRELKALQRELADEVDDTPVHQAVCRCVTALTGTLKDEYAEVLRRVDVGEEPLAAVAADAGITGNNAGVRLHRARKALRQRVQQMCGACAEHGCLDCSCKSPRPPASARA